MGSSGVVGFMPGCWVNLGSPWESLGSLGYAMGVVGYIRRLWVHLGSPGCQLGLLPVNRWVHRGCLGSLGFVLGVV